MTRPWLILLYILTILIPLIVIVQIILTISGNKIIAQATKMGEETSGQINRSITDVFMQYVEMSSRLTSDNTLMGYLNPNIVYASIPQVAEVYAAYLNPVVNYDFFVKNNNVSLKIYFLNPTLTQNYDPYVYADDNIQSSEVYQKAIRANGKIVWDTSQGAIILSRMMKDDLKHVIGVVALSINENRIYNLIKDINDKTILIADNQGQVISSNDRQWIGQSAHTVKSNGNIKVIEESLKPGGLLPDWSILTLIPLDNLLEDEKKIRNIGLVASLACLVVSCGLFLLSLNRITARLKKLVVQMGGVKIGEPMTAPVESNSDEIGVLTHTFNKMVKNLQQSIYENYEVNLKLKDIAIKKREAELYALRSQINPHFLFNTLDSIRMGLRQKGETEMAEVVLHLAKLFRNSLHRQGEFSLLEDEFDLIDNYISIQKYRFKDKIALRIQCADALLKYRIPGLTLQPIVENAVKHGIENKWGNGTITIAVAVVEHKLVITVQDDGIGMEPENLHAVRAELSEVGQIKMGKSIGLKNVNDRIVLHFGLEYGIRIDSEPGGGTLVSIELPARIG